VEWNYQGSAQKRRYGEDVVCIINSIVMKLGITAVAKAAP
jgi:hypothetical protein